VQPRILLQLRDDLAPLLVARVASALPEAAAAYALVAPKSRTNTSVTERARRCICKYMAGSVARECFYRVPPANTFFAISVTATCVELEIVNAVSGLTLTSSMLLVKDFSRANLNVRIRG
jgi:hypothetical protein